MGRHRKEIDLDRARELYESGLTFGEVAAEMGGIDRILGRGWCFCLQQHRR